MAVNILEVNVYYQPLSAVHDTTASWGYIFPVLHVYDRFLCAQLLLIHIDAFGNKHIMPETELD